MIQVLLVSLMAVCATYGWRQRRLSPVVGFSTPLLCLVGIALTLKPDWSQDAAAMLGVGRGADLVLYIWTVLSVLFIANLHFRLRAHLSMLTDITRELAILQARSPTAHQVEATSPPPATE